MVKEINERLKSIRVKLRMSQKDFANELGIKQGSLSDVERGRIGVSSKIIETVSKKFNVNSGWLYDGNGEIFIGNNLPIIQGKKLGVSQVGTLSEQRNEAETFDETKHDWATFVRKNKDLLQKVAREKIKYNELFHNQLSIENPDLETFYRSLNTIRDFRWALDSMEESKAGAVQVLFQTFLDDPYLTTTLPPFKDYKAERVEALSEIQAYDNIFNELAAAMNTFHRKMVEVGEKLNYKNEFYDDVSAEIQSE